MLEESLVSSSLSSAYLSAPLSSFRPSSGTVRTSLLSVSFYFYIISSLIIFIRLNYLFILGCELLMASNASTSIVVSSLLAKKPYLLEGITGKLDQNSLLSSSRTNR